MSSVTAQLLVLYSSSSIVFLLLLLAPVFLIYLSIKSIELRKSYSLDFVSVFGLINSVPLSLTRSINLLSSDLVNLTLVGSFWRLSNLHPFGMYHEIHFKRCNSVMTHISYLYQATETVLYKAISTCYLTFFMTYPTWKWTTWFQISIRFYAFYLCVLLPERAASTIHRGLYTQEESGMRIGQVKRRFADHIGPSV